MPDRKNHWESIYTDKSPLAVSWYQKEPTVSLQLIRNTGVSPGSPIIDVGGGASILVDHMLNEGYGNIAVLDISAEALRHAQSRLGSKAGAVEWFEQDITRFQPPHSFSLWHDRAVFHFLVDQSDRKQYINVLQHALEPRGHLIIASFAVGGPSKCSGLDVIQYDKDRIMAELGESFELVEEITEAHTTPANKLQEFVYFRFRRGGFSSPG